MKRIAPVALLIMFLVSMGAAMADENDVYISSGTTTIELYPGCSETFTIIVRSIGQEDSGTTSTTTNPSTTSSPTTSPPTTSSPTTPGPPPPPGAVDSTLAGSAASFSMQQSSMSLSSLMLTPQLTLSAEPPEGLEIEFEKTAFYVEYNTNVEVSVKIEASEDIEPGDYTIPIKVRSNSGHYDTIEVGVTVLPYIDIIINEVTVSDTLPDGGDNVVFTVSVTNMGESPTGEVTCAIYNKDTNERMASEVVSLSANETTEFDVNWTAVEGAYSFRVFISSPANEKITANNYYFLSMKVGPAFMPVDLGEEYFSEGLVYFESKKWQEAIDMFNLAIVEFQEDGEDNKVTTVQSYLDISSKYLEAHNLYNEGIDAMEAGDIALAKEKLRAAETIYTELGDLEKINLCFDQIISLNEPEEDANPKESSFLPYPWYTFTVPLLMIIVFLGYTSRSKPSTDLNALLLDLERMYEKGQISEGTYVKEKYKIKLKMLEKNA